MTIQYMDDEIASDFTRIFYTQRTICISQIGQCDRDLPVLGAPRARHPWRRPSHSPILSVRPKRPATPVEYPRKVTSYLSIYLLFARTILICATCGSRCLRIKNTESYERVRITWLNHLSVLCFSADTLLCVIVHSSAGLNCDCVTPPTLVFYRLSAVSRLSRKTPGIRGWA